MLDFFESLFRRNDTGSGSKDVAKERLQLVLVHDRVKVSPELLDLLKSELITVISKHVEIERSGIEVSVQRTENQARIVADIPVRRVRDEAVSTSARRSLSPGRR